MMHNLLELSPVAQFAIGTDHRIICWNHACEVMTGFPAARMIGTDGQWKPFYRRKRPLIADLLVDDDFPHFMELYREKGPGRSEVLPRVWEATDLFRDPGGRTHRISLRAVPIRDNKGDLIGAIEALSDITGRTQVENHLICTPGDLMDGMGHDESIQEASEDPSESGSRPCSPAGVPHRFGDIIGKGPPMQEVYAIIRKAAATDASVIVFGESGTGKEIVSRAIHDAGKRRKGPFVPVNCGAIPESLLESEFFGYRRGAFTGAHTDKHGYFDLADGGTLFLDEIGELSPNIQVKLLRVLENGEYMPVGSNRLRKSDFRMIAATNRDILELVNRGLMREDFFFRIHIIPIHLPALRDRREDIPLLIDDFLKNQGNGHSVSSIPARVMDAFRNYDWPGNVRELQNVLHRYLTVNRLDFVSPFQVGAGEAGPVAGREDPGEEVNLRAAVEDFEKGFILSALDRNRWNKSRAAAIMGISRRTLFRKLRYYDLM